jgi:hypothetical protein
MTADLLADLSRIQSYAAGLQRLLEEARASSPDTARGSDRSGSVALTLGQDGLPLSLRVSPDWARKIQPPAFAGAVVEASQAALGERMAAWVSALERDGWQAKVERLQADLDTPGAASGPGTAAGTIPPAFRRAPEPVRPRPLDVVVEDALRTFDAVRLRRWWRCTAPRPTRPASPAGSGRRPRIWAASPAPGR